MLRVFTESKFLFARPLQAFQEKNEQNYFTSCDPYHGILSDIYSCIQSGKHVDSLSGILSGKHVDILSGIQSGIY